jgi:hypothetical protein
MSRTVTKDEEMTKRYREELDEVEVTEEAGDERPTTFLWRGHRYRVTSVLGHWREDPGWWHRPSGEPIKIEQSDLWRVEAANGKPMPGVYELVRTGTQWRLDRVWD